MNGFKIASIVAFATCIGFFTYQWAGEPSTTNSQTFSDEVPIDLGEFTILPSVSTGNLQVFLIEGQEMLGDKNYVTLSSAMEENMVTVKETGSVNELSIDNESDAYIFIHSGDIVKGGKQDRTMAYDMIIPPNAKDVALQSFCVESGRWQARGTEDVDNFNSTTKMLSSKDLRLAAKYDNDQSKVWANVAQEQQELNYNVGMMNGHDVEVTDERSTTSLQLTLESEELEKAKTEMQAILIDLLKDHPNAVGFAYAINGEIYGVDIYNNRQLFEQNWERIAESLVIEAISDKLEEKFEFATVNGVSTFMKAINEQAENPDSKSLNKATDLNVFENEAGNIIFSTVDNDENQWIHKNYMKIDKTKQEAQEDQQLLQLSNDEINLDINQIQR
ncbi:MAG: hypothetical protein GQ574_25270 [Crocinitomix sp.]|nr:hypothetical protein [Crocinitomix sp.]